MLDAIARLMLVLVGLSLLVSAPMVAIYSFDSGGPSKDGFSVAVGAVGVVAALVCAVTGTMAIYGAIFALPFVMR